MVHRGSTPQSQVVMVPPPELPVMPTCFGVDLRAGQQVVERADAVPGAPGPEELADQELLVAGQQVLADRRRLGRCPWGVSVLQPLPLADRIEDQARRSPCRASPWANDW